MIINAIGSNIVPKNRLKAKTSKMNSLPADLSSYNSQKFEKSMARDTFVSSSNAMQNNKKAKDISFAGVHVNEKQVGTVNVTKITYGTDGDGRSVQYKSYDIQPVYQWSYRPYSWESKDIQKERIKKSEGITYYPETGLNVPKSLIQYDGTIYVYGYQRFNTDNEIVLPALNREESVKINFAPDYRYCNGLLVGNSLAFEWRIRSEEREIEYSKERIADLEKKIKNSKEKEDITRYESDIANYKRRIESAKHEIDKIKLLQEEVDTLATARKSGNLVDISVRNIDNPDSQLEDFLKKECKLANDETKTYDTDWVDKKIIALPNATVGVADAILMALGVSKAAAIAMSSAQKKFLITPFIKDSGFVNKVLDGLKSII